MKGDKELVGTLRGFDVYVNIVLEDVTDEIAAEGRRITKLDQILLNGNNIAISEIAAEGRRLTKLNQILLNGNNIAIAGYLGGVLFLVAAFFGVVWRFSDC